MPMTETIAIVNKSGKIVSSSKHIVNLFKDAKDAYNEKKAELHAEHKRREKDRTPRGLRDVRREELEYSSRHGSSERHRLEGPGKGKDKEIPLRPALTERNLSIASEGSVASSRRSSHHGDRASRSHKTTKSPKGYQAPYFENADISRTELVRRHTDHHSDNRSQSSRAPSGYGLPTRAMTNPNLHDDVDMHLAYGDWAPQYHLDSPRPAQKEQELRGLMSKMDKLMLEAHCLQHSASSIIETLQKNPEAMAAVALTLAEISNLISHMSPGILAGLKGSSPAVFALLASPQFLIAGGVAVGVTIVAFGGYKIIKKIQKDMAEKKEASRMDEALTFDGELSSIDNWRRGIADVEAQSVGTSVDGEYITPEAARIRKERIRDRAREERRERAPVAPSVADSSTSTVKRKDSAAPKKASSRSVATESVRSGSVARSESTVKPSKRDSTKEKKVKKPSALTVLFKRSSKKSDAGDSRAGDEHRPSMSSRLDL